ncbi:MAG: ComEC/Rec2 family competence protein [Aquificae bacterium]|nr:ComEC/Rec2 family competence protein [Aquificota bacterium]
MAAFLHALLFLLVLLYALFKTFSLSLDEPDAFVRVKLLSQWELEEGKALARVRVLESELEQLEGLKGLLILYGYPPGGRVLELFASVRLNRGSLVLSAPAYEAESVDYEPSLRDRLLARVEEALRDEELAGLAKAFLLGEERKNLPLSLQSSFLKTGLVHLLVVSGLHVGILYSFFAAVLPRVPGALAGAAAAALYGFFLVPPNPPALRATIMLILYALTVASYRRYCPLCALFFSGSVLLALFPQFSVSFSFWLSFLAVAYLIAVFKDVELTAVRAAFLASFAAFTGVTPLLAALTAVAPATLLLSPLLTPVVYLYALLGMLNLVTFFSFKPLVGLFELAGLLFARSVEALSGWAPLFLVKLSVAEGFVLSSAGLALLLLQRSLKGKLAVLLVLNAYLFTKILLGR